MKLFCNFRIYYYQIYSDFVFRFLKNLYIFCKVLSLKLFDFDHKIQSFVRFHKNLVNPSDNIWEFLIYFFVCKAVNSPL